MSLKHKLFQSTLLMRGATEIKDKLICGRKFQSTLLMRGATTSSSALQWGFLFQSTLLMRGATACRRASDATMRLFQSTLLMRGATLSRAEHKPSPGISIHAPHARSDDCGLCGLPACRYFNPRSSCEERRGRVLQEGLILIFQSTLLMRGATAIDAMLDDGHVISIHAPHARSDLSTRRVATTSRDFNPRSSCEERPSITTALYCRSKFQSTLLMRGATS